MNAQKPVPIRAIIFFLILLFCLSGVNCIPMHPLFPQGPGIRLLTPDLGLHGCPSWSPDGTRIAFCSAPLPRGSDPPEIYTMDTQGGNRVRLTDNSYWDIAPIWSPKGDRIVFVSNRDGAFAIYTMNPDGSDVVRLVEGDSPAWSPDGEKIAFRVGDEETAEIYIWERGHVTQLTSDKYYDAYPCWSPDGRQIVFTSKREGWYQLYVMNADGSEQRPLTSGPDRCIEPAWSPDGRWIVFRREPPLDSGRGVSVELLDLRTGQTRVLLNEPLCHSFAWSPDGKRLAFIVGGDASDIYVIDVATVLGTPFP